MNCKIKQPQLRISEVEQRAIVEDYLDSNTSKTAIWEKYTGRERGAYQILRWIRKYGYKEFLSLCDERDGNESVKKRAQLWGLYRRNYCRDLYS